MLVVLVLLVPQLGVGTQIARAKAFQVNSTADAGDLAPGDGSCDSGGGVCSLRAAIEEANALGGEDAIHFNIPTTDPGYTATPLSFVIAPATPLPEITRRVVIDGETQPGFLGTPIVVIDGSAAGPGPGLVIDASSSVVRGLVIHKFAGAGIEVRKNKIVIAGNYVGTDVTGVFAAGNGGGGVVITGNGNTLGGAATPSRNVIGGNVGTGVIVSGGSGNEVRGNYVGVGADGSTLVANSGDGVAMMSGGEGNIVAANVISGNAGDGVSIHGDTGTMGAVVSNAISANGGLGINLRPGVEDVNTVTPNDGSDLDTGPPNLGLNFPVVTAATESGGTISLDFSLDVNPAGDYLIEFFSNPDGPDPSGHGEGQSLVGSTVVTHSGVGVEFFSVSFSGAGGDVITATTSLCGAAACGSQEATSEFSAAVTAVSDNSPPVLDPIGPQSGDELTEIAFTAAASDPDLDDLTFTLTGEPPGATIAPATGVFSWTPTEGQGPGEYSFDVVVADDGSPHLSDVETITITVTEANVAPTIISPGDLTGDEGDRVSLVIAASDSDSPPNTLTWSASGLPDGLSIDPGTGTIGGVLARPGAAATTHTVTVEVDDGAGGSASVVFAWTVIPAASILDAVDDAYSVDSRGTLVVDGPGVLANDSGVAPVTVTLAAGPSFGSVTLAPDGSFTYTHDGSSDVDDNFTYLLTDGEGGEAIASVTIDVVRLNSPPVTGPDSIRTNEDSAVSFDPLANDTDPDGDPISLVSIGQPGSGTLSEAGSGTLVYSPPADYAGTTTATYTVSDGSGGTATGTIELTVTPLNDAPIGTPDRLTLFDYLPATIPVLANDSDPDGDPLAIAWVSDVEVGEVEIDGFLIGYTPQSDWSGTTTFTYGVSDPSGAIDVVEVSVTVKLATQLVARSLIEELKSGTAALVGLSPTPQVAEVPLTPVKSISLMVDAFYQTIGAFRLPFIFLGLSMLVLVGFGGVIKVPLFLAGRGRTHWSVVLLDREKALQVRDEPEAGSAIIYNFNPTTESILSTGKTRESGGKQWTMVHTPRGEGWVDAFHLTEQVDVAEFGDDHRPPRLVVEFADVLRSGGDVAPLISDRGIVLALTGHPTRLAPHQFADLLGGSRLRRLPTIGGVLQAQDDFRVAVAEPFLAAFEATKEVTAVTAHSEKALIPAEVWNFRYLALGEKGPQPWLVFFEYEQGKPRIVGLGIDE